MNDMNNGIENRVEYPVAPSVEVDESTVEIPMTPDNNAGLPEFPEGLNNDAVFPGANAIEDPKGDDEKPEKEEQDLVGGRPSFPTKFGTEGIDPEDSNTWNSVIAAQESYSRI